MINYLYSSAPRKKSEAATDRFKSDKMIVNLNLQ